MTDALPYISGAFIGWQIGNSILGKPVDTAMLAVAVLMILICGAIGVFRALRNGK
jgi:uncharacterized membrane protein YfcA